MATATAVHNGRLAKDTALDAALQYASAAKLALTGKAAVLSAQPWSHATETQMAAVFSLGFVCPPSESMAVHADAMYGAIIAAVEGGPDRFSVCHDARWSYILDNASRHGQRLVTLSNWQGDSRTYAASTYTAQYFHKRKHEVVNFTPAVLRAQLLSFRAGSLVEQLDEIMAMRAWQSPEEGMFNCSASGVPMSVPAPFVPDMEIKPVEGGQGGHTTNTTNTTTTTNTTNTTDTTDTTDAADTADTTDTTEEFPPGQEGYEYSEQHSVMPDSYVPPSECLRVWAEALVYGEPLGLYAPPNAHVFGVDWNVIRNLQHCAQHLNYNSVIGVDPIHLCMRAAQFISGYSGVVNAMAQLCALTFVGSPNGPGCFGYPPEYASALHN